VKFAHLALALSLPLAACSLSEKVIPVAGFDAATDRPPSGVDGPAARGDGGGAPAPFTDAAVAPTPDASLLPAPSDFTMTDVGGYKLGDPIGKDSPVVSIPGGSGGGCNIIVGVVRDFKGKPEPGGHPDFEAFQGDKPTVGLVASALGADQKPVYASRCEAGAQRGSSACPYGQMTTSAALFDQWYRLTDGVNKPYLVYLLFQPNGTLSTFSSSSFFPLDGAGWGNSGTDTAGKPHDFGFTTEVHTRFKYSGGERFTFSGDDDLWVFINGKLAMDLGGLHPKAMATLQLDQSAATLQIEKGMTYSLDLFHAERHSQASNFRVDTNFTFVDCGRVIQ
jgi:fibro-slime domain-containing protein